MAARACDRSRARIVGAPRRRETRPRRRASLPGRRCAGCAPGTPVWWPRPVRAGVERFGACAAAQPIENRQDNQRRESLRRRGRLNALPTESLVCNGFTRDAASTSRSPRRSGAKASERGRRCLADVTAVEIVETLPRHLPEGRCKRRKALQRACRRRLAVVQIRCRKPGLRREFVGKPARISHLVLSHRRAVARVADRILQQPRRRQTALGGIECRLPSRNRAGDGVGGKRASCGIRVQAAFAVERRCRQCGSATAGVDAEQRLAGSADQRKAVAADPAHVWINDRDGGSDRRCFHRVAAITQYRATGLRGKMIGRGHHPARRHQCFQHVSPRRVRRRAPSRPA